MPKQYDILQYANVFLCLINPNNVSNYPIIQDNEQVYSKLKKKQSF